MSGPECIGGGLIDLRIQEEVGTQYVPLATAEDIARRAASSVYRAAHYLRLANFHLDNVPEQYRGRVHAKVGDPRGGYRSTADHLADLACDIEGEATE